MAPADLVEFGWRNDGWLGDGFRPPPTEAAWAAVGSDPTQAWFAIVPGRSLTTPVDPLPPSRSRPAPGVVGLLVLSRIAPAPWRSAEFGFAVDRSFAGQGLIQTTAPGLLDTFLLLEVARVEARVDPDNGPAVRVLQRLGFSFEGHARGSLDGRGGRRTQAQWAITSADRKSIPAGRSPGRPLDRSVARREVGDAP